MKDKCPRATHRLKKVGTKFSGENFRCKKCGKIFHKPWKTREIYVQRVRGVKVV